jgi:hypothetical protein
MREGASGTFVRAAAWLAICWWSLDAAAVSPRLSVIQPRGGQAGTELEASFQGQNLSDALDVMFEEPGIELVELRATEDKAVTALLRIAPDCRVGLHALRVRTATGVSGLQLFSVGKLAEVKEAEPNNTPDQAQVLAMDSVVNGVIPSEDVDYYAVELVEGQRIAVEVEAIRLGRSLFDVKLRLFGPGGHELIAEDDTALMRQDAAFIHVAKEAGRHLIAVSESAYGGNGAFDYRLHVGNFPRPLSVTPMGGQPGETLTVRWLGDPGVGEQQITVPEGDEIVYIYPATDSGVAPSPMPFRVSPYAGVLEQEPNNNRDEATPGAYPGAFDGVISEPGDIDFFSFEGKKDQRFRIQVFARALGSPLDSVLQVFGPDGKSIGSDDDGAGADSRLDVTLPEDGVYTLAVRDHLRGGGPTYAYRVEAFPLLPQMNARLEHATDAAFVVPKGNRAFMTLVANRGGISGPVGVSWSPIPEGVQLEHGELADGQTQLPIVVHAASEAPTAGVMMDLRLTGRRGDAEIIGGLNQAVSLVKGANDVIFESHKPPALAFAVGEPAPFSLEIVPPKVPLVQRGNMQLKVIATRAEEFAEPIKLTVPFIPSNFGAGTATIPGDQNETTILIEANGSAPAGETAFVVQGEAAGYRVCTTFTPIQVNAPWVDFQMPEIQTEQGQPVEIKVTMTKAQDFEGTHKVELLGLPKGLTTTPQEFTKDTTELTFPVEVAADAPEGKHGPLLMRAVIVQNEEPILHASQGERIVIYKPLPPALQAAAPEPKPEEKKEEKKEAPQRKTRFPQNTQ